MQGLFIACLITLTVAASSGCTRQDEVLADKRSPSPAIRPVLVIGLIPEQNVFRQLERYRPLAEYLSERTGTEIKLKVLLRYGNIINNFMSEGLDGAFFGSFTYTIAHARLGVKVIARPEDLDGRSTYHGVIFTRRDSGIRTIADMRGKRLAFVDKATTAGYLVPLAYFRTQGIDYRTYLRETYFAGTHENAILDVLDRKADAGAAKNTVFERPIGANRRSVEGLRVVLRSPEVPENALAFKQDLDPALVEKIRSLLLSMHGDPEGAGVLAVFKARRFIATTDADYRPVYRSIREAGIDPATYDYLNE